MCHMNILQQYRIQDILYSSFMATSSCFFAEMPMILSNLGHPFYLKVPKCEIFNRSDFPAFYTIKSRREGDFGVKIKKF